MSPAQDWCHAPVQRPCAWRSTLARHDTGIDHSCNMVLVHRSGMLQQAHTKRSLHTESEIFVCVFFISVILSYLNACYGFENAENRTWSKMFYDGRKFRRQCVNVIDTTWGHIYFLTCENFWLGVQWLSKMDNTMLKKALHKGQCCKCILHSELHSTRRYLTYHLTLQRLQF